jgi:flagellar basal-body rod protein FlgF
MDNTNSIALSRLTAQERAMDVVATNIANASTPGFRGQRIMFSDWLMRAGNGETVAFTQDRATYRDTAPGPLTHTGNPLDLALGGDGYFSVTTPRGTRLTRAGHFELDATGNVVDELGNALQDSNGQPIHLTPSDTRLTVAGDGTLSSENGRIARIGVVAPQDPLQLQAEGGRLFNTPSPTAPVATPKIVQGAIENSNVQPALELTRMMNQLREFEFTSQFLQSEAEREQGAIDKITQKRN